MKDHLHVVVPFYNEEKLIGTLVDSFHAQTDQHFHVIYVDNNSSDSSIDIINEKQKNSKFTYEIIEEKEKGTGSASDTGFRHAINIHKACFIARTDADCLLDSMWIKNIKKNMINEGLDFIGGIIKPRDDDIKLTLAEKLIIKLLLFTMELYGKVWLGIIGYKYIFFLVSGNNLAITSSMYIKSGGFPRTSIDTTDEDMVLSQSVRRLTRNVKQCKDVIVYNSTRRLKRYGAWNILMWYKNRAYKPDIIDIR